MLKECLLLLLFFLKMGRAILTVVESKWCSLGKTLNFSAGLGKFSAKHWIKRNKEIWSQNGNRIDF